MCEPSLTTTPNKEGGHCHWYLQPNNHSRADLIAPGNPGSVLGGIDDEG
jgi:hypothetical protein